MKKEKRPVKNQDHSHRQQEMKKSSNVTGPAETSEASTFGSDGNDLDVGGIEHGLGRDVGTQDRGENIGGQEAGGIAGSGGVSTTDVGQRGPGKSIDIDR